MNEFFKDVTKPRFLNLINILNNANIQYFASGGTLLGAIRHNGIIPWDNDCDIAILESDKVKCMETIVSTNEYFLWQCMGDGNVNSEGKRKLEITDFSKHSTISKNGHGIYIASTQDCSTVTDLEIFIKSEPTQYWNDNRNEYDVSNGIISYALNGFRYAKDGKLNIPYNMAFPLTRHSFYDIEINVFKEAETYLKLKYGDECLIKAGTKFDSDGDIINDFSAL